MPDTMGNRYLDSIHIIGFDNDLMMVIKYFWHIKRIEYFIAGVLLSLCWGGSYLALKKLNKKIKSIAIAGFSKTIGTRHE